MADEPDLERWKQLGRYLERRRYELDPEFRNLTLFCEERSVDYRLCWDIEHARRTNYRRATLADIARAYGLDGWAIEEYVEDGRPLVAPNPYTSDPDLAEVWEKSSGLRSEERHGLVKLAKKMRDRGGNGNRRSEETRKRA